MAKRATTQGADLAYHERHFARFYDWEYADRTQDITFFEAMAQRHGSPVLELGCGTGRISLPLARAGFDVIGLDLAGEMLRLLRGKLRQEAQEVRRRLRMVQGDMTDFTLSSPARLAFVPFSSFLHLHSPEQRLGCLTSVYRALAPGGVFIVDMLPPRVMEQQMATPAPEELRCEVNPETGLMTQELHQRLMQDRAAKRTTVEHTFVEYLPSGRTRRYSFVQDYSWVTERELRGLFAQAGFRHVKVCGGYGLRPFKEKSYRMIFLGEK